MRYLVFTAILFICLQSQAQLKSFIISVKGDTLNKVDNNNKKQGPWVMHVDDLRGEPGYEEEGYFEDDKKEGNWRRYALSGDLTAIENFKWGEKDGKQQYFTKMGDLLREESWRAIDPLNPYDTIRVYHLDNPDKYDLKIVKVESSAVKHGIWTYYDPERGTIIKTEEYVIDQLVSNKKPALNTGNTGSAKNTSAADSLLTTKKKPAEVLEYEKKNQKKKIKVRDGATGVD